MQTQFYNFLKDTIKTISPLLFTGLGGFISYKSSSLIESRKEKRKQNIEKLNNILIPLCQYVENSINIFKTLEFDDENFNYLISETKRFLKVENKIYYKNSIKKNLNDFFQELNNFKKTYDIDLINIDKEFHDYINSILYNYVPSSIQTIEYNNSSKIKNLIFKESTINEEDFLKLLKNDAEFNAYDKDPILLNSRCEISEEEIDIFSGAQNDKWDTNNILLFIFENSSLDKLEEIIHKKSTIREQFENILEELTFLNKIIINEINKIVE